MRTTGYTSACRRCPSLPPEEAKAQVERLMTNPKLCRRARAPAGEGTPGAELGPLLQELFEQYSQVEFLLPSGHVPDDLRFDCHALRPSIYLVGYIQLNHFAWISSETAVKPREDTVYVIDARELRGGGPVLRKREVPEVTETVSVDLPLDPGTLGVLRPPIRGAGTGLTDSG